MFFPLKLSPLFFQFDYTVQKHSPDWKSDLGSSPATTTTTAFLHISQRQRIPWIITSHVCGASRVEEEFPSFPGTAFQGRRGYLRLEEIACWYLGWQCACVNFAKCNWHWMEGEWIVDIGTWWPPPSQIWTHPRLFQLWGNVGIDVNGSAISDEHHLWVAFKEISKDQASKVAI